MLDVIECEVVDGVRNGIQSSQNSYNTDISPNKPHIYCNHFFFFGLLILYVLYHLNYRTIAAPTVMTGWFMV